MKKRLPWYKDGLHFSCTGCGECCSGAPGYVWISPKEIETISKRLSLSQEEFLQKYTRKVFGRISLIEDPTNYDCVFLQDKKCTIYTDRPSQCRSFPWWKQNLASPQAWKEAACYCEGIQPNAPLVSLDTIEKQKTDD